MVLTVLMLFALVFTASAKENPNGTNPKTEAEILDEMAPNGIETWAKNIKY